jgi:steroid delta-isomerase-like uncharacterized protein
MNGIIVSNSTPVISPRQTGDKNLPGPTEMTNAARIWQTVLDAWAVGDIDEVVNQFADEFTFIDHALEFEFKDKDRLYEFLVKIRESFPDSERTDHILLSDGLSIVSEWNFAATQNEPFLYGHFLKEKISAQGISVVRVRNGRIAKWSEYYDQVTSRRYRLRGWFTDWCEV